MKVDEIHSERVELLPAPVVMAPGQKAKRKILRKPRLLLAVSITVAVTLFVTVLFLNLRAGEKQIRYEITHRFAVSDPQFVRTMSQLLGPGLLTGNRITAFHNGDEIFPAMIEA